MRCSMQIRNALDADRRRTFADDLRAHRTQTARQIDDFGFARRVLENRLALGQRRRHHQVFGAGHGDRVEHDVRALELAALGVDEAAFERDLGAHRFQAHQVQIDRSRADRAAAGQRHVGFAASCHQRAEYQNRGTHRAHQFVRRHAGRDRLGVEHDRMRVGLRDGHAHLREQLLGRADVPQRGAIGDGQRLVGQQRSAQDRQRGVLAPLAAISPLSGPLPSMMNLSKPGTSD